MIASILKALHIDIPALVTLAHFQGHCIFHVFSASHPSVCSSSSSSSSSSSCGNPVDEEITPQWLNCMLFIDELMCVCVFTGHIHHNLVSRDRL